ncbi:hypothetical protein [Rhodococcus jostii]|uniref:hypothetical protein n=1 Tax=Rhodococcus jostii TaxID=132919 RepID=UPI00363B0198
MTDLMSDTDLAELNGEVIEAPTRSVDVLPPSVSDKVAALSVLDGQSQARAVTALLSHSRTGLLAAIAAQDLPGIVEFKAKAAGIHEIAKQLRLAKDMQADAAEFVRRAERGVGVGIREGQANGDIRKRGETESRANQHGSAKQRQNKKSSPTDYASASELNGNSSRDGNGIYDMTDNVTDEQFEEALGEARAEDNLSRANVARKCKTKAKQPVPADPVSDAPQPGVGVPKPFHGFKKNSTEMLDSINHMLQGAVQTLEFIDADDVDPAQRSRIRTELFTSLNTIRKFMKEVSRDR